MYCQCMFADVHTVYRRMLHENHLSVSVSVWAQLLFKVRLHSAAEETGKERVYSGSLPLIVVINVNEAATQNSSLFSSFLVSLSHLLNSCRHARPPASCCIYHAGNLK